VENFLPGSKMHSRPIRCARHEGDRRPLAKAPVREKSPASFPAHVQLAKDAHTPRDSVRG